MKTAVIYNSKASSMLQRRNKHFLKDLKDLFGENSIKADFFDVASTETAKILSSAATNGYDAVIAAGGDGTMRNMAGFLTGSGVPLGIIPIGNLNHFALNHRIPLNFEKAVKTISNNYVKTIYPGEVNGNIFMNSSSIGFYPTLFRKRDKIRHGKWTSAFKALFIAYSKIPILTIKIFSEGEPVLIKTPFVFIGNNEYRINVLKLKSKHKTGNGCFNVFYPTGNGIFSIIRFSFKALINRLEEEKDYKVIGASELYVTSGSGTIDLALDGDIYHLDQPLHYKLHPLELKIIAPPDLA